MVFIHELQLRAIMPTMLHSEWSAPLGLPAPVWGVLTLIGYLLFWRVSLKR
tara:strand:- start:62 stop:214 length:153 start_codon:yes stop_codon:yes gene_type:complete